MQNLKQQIWFGRGQYRFIASASGVWLKRKVNALKLGNLTIFIYICDIHFMQIKIFAVYIYTITVTVGVLT